MTASIFHTMGDFGVMFAMLFFMMQVRFKNPTPFVNGLTGGFGIGGFVLCLVGVLGSIFA